MKHALVPYEVIHKRFTPKVYEFKHRFFWFKLNLDDLRSWPTRLVGINRPSLYSFYDQDHVDFGLVTAKENYIQFAKDQGLKQEIKEVTLYTSLRFLGYVFNPVSFILLKDSDDNEHAIIEIGNTFNEIKPFFVSHDHFKDDGFVYKTKKLFYISPFIKHDNEMTFVLKKEENQISIFIDDTNGQETTLKVWFKGNEKPATTLELIKQTLSVPFVTLKTIFLIHWHALILFIKGIHYYKKDEHPELQKGQFVWKK